MSEYVKTLPHHNNLCTYESLEMGCHFLSQYRQRLLGMYMYTQVWVQKIFAGLIGKKQGVFGSDE